MASRQKSILVAQPLGPTQSLNSTYPTHDIRVLCKDSEGVHAQGVSRIAVFIVKDFDLRVARRATAGSQSDGPGPMPYYNKLVNRQA